MGIMGQPMRENLMKFDRENIFKKLKKVSKKVLTKGIGSDIILRLSRKSDSEKLLEN